MRHLNLCEKSFMMIVQKRKGSLSLKNISLTFLKKYSAKDLFIWHHVLTGSCKAGREAFCKDKGIDVDNDRFTVYEFIELTKNSYGGEIIRKLS